MPTDVYQLRSLLSRLSYDRKFLGNLTTELQPVLKLPNRGVTFEFTEAIEEIVRKSPRQLSEPPVVVFPDWDTIEDGARPFRLCCDDMEMIRRCIGTGTT